MLSHDEMLQVLLVFCLDLEPKRNLHECFLSPGTPEQGCGSGVSVNCIVSVLAGLMRPLAVLCSAVGEAMP